MTSVIEKDSGSYGHLASALFLCAITFLVCWAYLPGIGGPKLLDDRSYIPVINTETLSLSEAEDIVFGNTSGPLGRPVAMASFVGEAVALGAGTPTGKAVNVGLHVVNTALVYLLVQAIFSGFRLASPNACACIAAMIWCWAPLQVSTVLYHVQRMTLLCTFFMLLTLLCSIQWRNLFEAGSRLHFIWFGAVTINATLALFAKENAATLALMVPAMLSLAPGSPDQPKSVVVTKAAHQVFFLVLGVAVCVVIVKWSWIVAGYQVRDYSALERVLSQPRVLVDYMLQFFYPDTGRMGLVHDDFMLSDGLFSPPATVLSIGFFTALLCLGFWFRRGLLGKQILLCVLIFLVGHSVESSVIALEPYFEHRNYFPSVGLALAIGFATGACLKKAPALKAPLILWLFIYGVLLLVETGTLARVWSKGEILALHEVIGHPESPRANRALALMQARSGDTELAMHYTNRAYPEVDAGAQLNRLVYAQALSCVSGQPLAGLESAIVGELAGLRDRAAREAMQLLIVGVHEGRCDRSAVLALADKLYVLAVSTDAGAELVPLLSTLAVLENALERYERALWYTEQALSQAPDSVQLLLMSLHFCSATQATDACDGVRQRLRGLEQSGLLDAGQRETFALYKNGE